MDHFYDGQVKRYLTQFMRVMSNFSYKDNKGKLTQVPVRYGDMNRQVAQILAKNSENIVQSAPFIACYIKDLQFNRDMMQDPTYVSKVHIRERATNDDGSEYLNTQGANYTVERIMPSPYTATFVADIWTTNTEQKFQLWEQLVVLFNPALEIQTTDNYLDWTSLSYLELTSQQFESRTVPQGLEADISICTMNFTAPIWITPPAKLKKLGIVTKIISNVLESKPGQIAAGTYNDYELADLYAGNITKAKISFSVDDYDVLVLNNVATLLPVKNSNITNSAVDLSTIANRGNWRSLLDLHPGQFVAGVSQLRLTKEDGNEVVAYLTLNPTDESSMILSIDADTIPQNTIIDSSGIVNAIINPQTFNPTGAVAGTRYLILDDIIDTSMNDNGSQAWSGFTANANDIVSWDGNEWTVIFDSQSEYNLTYITNYYTGIQYKWDGEAWSKSFEGVYENGAWRLVL